MLQILPASSEQIVHTDDRVTLGEQRIAEMRAQKAGAAGD